MAEERSLPGWPKKRLVKEVRRHLVALRDSSRGAIDLAGHLVLGHMRLPAPTSTSIGPCLRRSRTQYILLLLAEMHESHCLRLPYRGREILPPEVAALLPVLQAAGLPDDRSRRPQRRDASGSRSDEPKRRLLHNQDCSKTSDRKAFP